MKKMLTLLSVGLIVVSMLSIFSTVRARPVGLPRIGNWRPGDAHIHSGHSAPEAQRSIGDIANDARNFDLEWIIITDHSYWMDGAEWEAARGECEQAEDDELVVMCGEEISVDEPGTANSGHFLGYGLSDFVYTPFGDLWPDEPDAQDAIDEVIENQHGAGFIAHPNDGTWGWDDWTVASYTGIEVWNGEWSSEEVEDAMILWDGLLTNGLYSGTHAVGIGNSDAHPWISYTPNVWTYLLLPSLTHEGVIDAYKGGHAIFTNGPLLTLKIGQKLIGDTVYVSEGSSATLNFQWDSSGFGEMQEVTIRKIAPSGSTNYPRPVSGTSGSASWTDPTPVNEPCYYRLEGRSVEEHTWPIPDETFHVYTNPIWVYPSGGPDSFGYTYLDSNIPTGPDYDWVEISGTGTEILPNSDDDWITNINIGFFFNYYGTDYSQLSIGNNGLLFSGVGTRQYVNDPITQSPGIHGFIAPYWDDIVTWGSAGAIYYQTIGTAPNRRFVVEWYNNGHYHDSSEWITLEAILYEGTNNILFQYQDVTFGSVSGAVSGDNPPYDNGGSATVGIEDPTGNIGLQYSFNEQVITPGLAILFKFPAFAGTNMYLSMNAPASMDRGSSMTYTLYYNDFGDVAASNVVLQATLSTNVDFISASDGGTYDAVTRRVTWNIGTVPAFPSGRGLRTVTVAIPSSILIGTVIQTTASITTSTLETRYDDNTASVQTTVTGSSLPPNVGVGPILGNLGGTPSVYWTTPITFTYNDPTATGVDIRIHFDSGGTDITGSMTGGPPLWSYTTTFYPRNGHATVTYTVHYPAGDSQVNFGIYIDPAGYIYDVVTLERISGASVWLQCPDGEGGWENVPTGQTPPIMQPDVNPQITGADGQYQWDVLEGTYRVHVEAPGYYPADSIVVIVPPPVTDLHVGLTPLPPPPDPLPPTTTLSIGDPKCIDSSDNIYVTSDTPCTLSAEDNVGGSGVAATGYRIRNATYDSGWTASAPPIEFYFTGLADGVYLIDYNSTDNIGNIETTHTVSVTLDNSSPSIVVENPPAGCALQDGVNFRALSTDPSGTHSSNFSIREANGDQGIPVGFEDMPAAYNTTTGKWEFFFNTLQLPDGFYIVLIDAEDNLGHTASITVPYSIRNWAVLELLPATPNNKAGRTMPIKFALRVAASVDPNQPFVYNEELTIKIYATDNPSNILQTSTFGDTARDYRINTLSEHYITNFQTLKTPKTYMVEVWRKDMLIDTFNFNTIINKSVIM